MKNLYTKEKLLEEINQVRKEIGHEELEIHIKDIYYNEKEKELWIITQDRPDKSAIIGKGWDGLSAYSPLNRPVFV